MKVNNVNTKPKVDISKVLDNRIVNTKITENHIAESLNINNEDGAADILKIRLIKKTTAEGNICVLDAEKFYHHIVKLLFAIAADVKTPKKYHKGPYEAFVHEFIKQCSFGQTETGSYIVNTIIPLKVEDKYDENKNESEDSLFTEETYENLFGRQVVIRIMNSANQLKEAIDKNRSSELLNLSRKDMISSNVCEAIAGLNLDGVDTELEISAEFSDLAPIYEDVCDHVSFTNDYYEPLRKIGEELKDDSREKILEFTGYVTGVKSDANIAKRKNGIVSISYKDENNKMKTIKVTLNIEDYDIALIAHRNGYRIQFKGIKKEDNSIEYSEFKIIDARYDSEMTLFK